MFSYKRISITDTEQIGNPIIKVSISNLKDLINENK